MHIVSTIISRFAFPYFIFINDHCGCEDFILIISFSMNCHRTQFKNSNKNIREYHTIQTYKRICDVLKYLSTEKISINIHSEIVWKLNICFSMIDWPLNAIFIETAKKFGAAKRVVCTEKQNWCIESQKWIKKAKENYTKLQKIAY